jgi:hypothetical protein
MSVQMITFYVICYIEHLFISESGSAARGEGRNTFVLESVRKSMRTYLVCMKRVCRLMHPCERVHHILYHVIHIALKPTTIGSGVEIRGRPDT